MGSPGTGDEQEGQDEHKVRTVRHLVVALGVVMALGVGMGLGVRMAFRVVMALSFLVFADFLRLVGEGGGAQTVDLRCALVADLAPFDERLGVRRASPAGGSASSAAWAAPALRRALRARLASTEIGRSAKVSESIK